MICTAAEIEKRSWHHCHIAALNSARADATGLESHGLRLGTAFPDGIHLLVKPQERFEASQGTLDWFRFWLMGAEDSDPAKSAQYGRWRAMRESKPGSSPPGRGN